MATYLKAVFVIVITGVLAVVANAQVPADETAPNVPASVSTSAPADDDAPYTLMSGDNEFGGWGGISFKATTAFGGLTDAEATDRKFFLAAFRYGRTLYANDSI